MVAYIILYAMMIIALNNRIDWGMISSVVLMWILFEIIRTREIIKKGIQK